MNKDKKSAANNYLVIDFLAKIIDVNNDKQQLYDNRASMLLTANAILLAGITGFGIPLVQSNIANQWAWVVIILTIISLLLPIISIVLVVQLIAPIASTQKSRNKHLDLTLQESNLFFFFKIAEYKKQEYLNKVKGLSEKEIIEQLAAEAHNVSRLLSIRLIRLKRAYLMLIVSVIIFGLLSIVNLLI